MFCNKEFLQLHNLQGNLALKRDWIAVGRLQALIEHLAAEYPVSFEEGMPTALEPTLH